MFRSLLNTLPVLSGNFTIACKLNNISKKTNEEFESYIYEASLKPLDDNIKLYKSIAINLMNGKYSFDIKKYINIIDIHKSVYKNNYTTFVDLDKTLPVDDRNKIYEYGCKRISYKYHKDEWSFYAPFYINNFEDIPDYFIIEVKKKNSSQVLKKIKVYVGKKKTENKLYYYLKRHIEQIENNIPITWQYNNKEIILHNAIDYNNGVIMSRLIDSNSQIFYHNHVTINEFDSMLNNLYYDNGFILSEVIPLSFEFTLSDFLEKSEYRYFQMNDFTIDGYYLKGDNKYPFYIFETNSHNLMLSYKEYENNEIITKQYNVYNKIGNNSLHEATNILLKTNNTISKQYCKWVNYDDENYYANNNISYSTKYGKYGSFPIFKNLSDNTLKLKVDFIDKKLNAWVPNSEYFEYDYDVYSKYSLDNECVIYNNMKINNISSWFEILNEDMISDSIFNNSIKWSKVNKFNHYCFYKGIIYKDLPEDIDYFGVFLKLNIKDISNSKIANFLINSSNDNIEISNISTYELYNYNGNKEKIEINSYINEEVQVTKNNIDSIKKDIEENKTEYYKFVSENKELYIDYSLIKSTHSLHEIKLNSIYNTFENQFIINNLAPIIKIIDSYEILENITFSDVYNYYSKFYKDELENIIQEKFGDIYYLNIYNGTKRSICEDFFLNNNYDKNELEEYIDKNISRIFKKKSFVYIIPKTQIYELVSNIAKNIGDIGDTNISLKFDYLNDGTSNIIVKNNIIKFVNFVDNNVFINENAKNMNKIKNYLLYFLHIYINNKIENYQLYHYEFDTSISTTLLIDYFKKYESLSKNGYRVYIDSYNIKKIITDQTTPLHSMIDTVFYCKFINLDHFKEYCKKLYTNDITNNAYLNNQIEIFNTIFCKRTILDLAQSNEFNLINLLCPLKNRIYAENSNIDKDINNNLITENIIDKLLKNISYNGDKFIINVGKILELKDENDNIIDSYISCELYYKKQLVELTDKLLNILKNIKIKVSNLDEIKEMSNYMYYYSYNDSGIYNSSYYFSEEENSLLKQYNEKIIDKTKLLHPIFESVYLNYDNGDNFIEINNLFLNSLENSMYIKNHPETSIYKLVNESEISVPDEDESPYILYKKIKVNFAEVENYDENSKIHIYENTKTNTKYGYFIINEYISNNTESYRIEDVMYEKMTLELVNNKPFSKNIFLDIYPFIKNDIFLDVSQQIKDWIVYPTHVKLKNIYKAVYVGNKENTSLIKNNQSQYLYLNRYFGNIMPSIKPVKNNILDMYKKIYKEKNKNIVNDENLLAYIQTSCNIYRNQPIFYISNINDLVINENDNKIKEFICPENKHFMDNLLYHLPKTIEYTVPQSITITYNDIEKYEVISDIENSKIFEYFKQYIKNNFNKKFVNKNNKEDIETLLFLFKMYSYIVEKNVIKYDINLNNKLYSITYKLTLK